MTSLHSTSQKAVFSYSVVEGIACHVDEVIERLLMRIKRRNKFSISRAD